MDTTAPQPEQTWDAQHYDKTFSYVSALGRDLLIMLAPAPGEVVLDLGCGTGELLAAIVAAGATGTGVDNDPAMVAAARERLPESHIVLGGVEQFQLTGTVDAVFSNAALHWMTDPEAVLQNVSSALVPGGRFVAEMGGRRNVAGIIGALREALADFGYEIARMPWYFPSAGEYATLLEAHGFRVAHMEHFPRLTPLLECQDGIADWIRMFGGNLTAAVPPDRLGAVLARANEVARPHLFIDGGWHADYWRLRFKAVKERQ